MLSYIEFLRQYLQGIGEVFLAITTVLIALSILIRDSKPKFARFPIPMTFFPLIGLFFYPLVMNNSAVKGLLHVTYREHYS